MFQRIATWMVVAILALSQFFGVASSVLAQSDLGFPASIAVTKLASGEVPSSADSPGAISLDRIVLPAKAGLPVRQVPTIEILYVEKGTLTVADGLGLSSALPAEKSVHLRAGSSYTAINDSADDVSFLRLSFVGEISAATPGVAASTQVSAKAVVTSLASFDVATMPTSPATLFLNRATWKSDADTGTYIQNGPIGMYTESGTLTITSPSGIDGELGEGKAVLLPADQELRTRNDGNDDAVALLFGIVPANGPATTAVAGAAVESQADSLGTPSTGSDTMTSTTAGTVLYQVDANGGFEQWPAGSGWTAVGGILAGDGSVVSDGDNDAKNDKPIVIAAPFSAPVPDYAVEVEVQWARDGSSYGIIVRGGDDGGYWIGGGMAHNCSNDAERTWLPAVWVGLPQWDRAPCYDRDARIKDKNAIAVNNDVALDTDWHTYRIEVQGNAIRVFMDGTKIIETSDNRYLTSGQIGFFSVGSQVSFRNLTVTAL